VTATAADDARTAVEPCQVGDLQPGDLITEADTPDGPYYAVKYIDWRAPAVVLDEDIAIPAALSDTVLRRVEPALGIFRAVRTRDANGLGRHGQPYVEARRLDTSAHEGLLYEIRFRDGEWMLAMGDDLDGQVTP
jgi:hypothetical protein